MVVIRQGTVRLTEAVREKLSDRREVAQHLSTALSTAAAATAAAFMVCCQ